MTAMWIQMYSYCQWRYYLLGLTVGTLFTLTNTQELGTLSPHTIPGTPSHPEELNTDSDPSLRAVNDRDHSDMWTEIEKELQDMLLDVQKCSNKTYKCFGNESSSTTNKQRDCACDASCDDYGECCLDQGAGASPSTRDEHSPNMFCGRLDDQWNAGIFMIGDCPRSMVGTMVDDFCNQKVPLDVYDIIFDIPVVSLATNHTYRNSFCASCNNDADNLLELDMKLTCSNSNTKVIHPIFEKTNQTIEEFLLGAKYLPGERTYELPLQQDESSVNLGPSSSAATLTCKIEIEQYQHFKTFPSNFGSRICTFPRYGCWSNHVIEKLGRPCIKLIRTCDSSWPFPSDFEKCRSYSFVVFSRTENVLYKNPHCAKCNFFNTFQELACTNWGFNSTVLSRRQFDTPFSVLFEISDKPFTRCEKENYIWNPLFRKCTEIICGSGRVFRSGKCVQNAPVNSTLQPNSTLQVNCPTVAIDNFTIYENESVYYYVGDILYPKGDYELYNESLILVCIEESYYYREFSPLHLYTTVIVLSVSLVCLAFHIILYCCFSRMRTFHGTNLLCLCWSLFIAQFLFLTGITATDNYTFCVFMSICLHYFWLASFFWMNVLSIDVWRTFRTRVSHNSLNKRKLFLYYSLYAWGFPFVIVGFGLASDLTDSLSKYRPTYAGQTVAVLCWINNKLGLLCFFLIPVGFIVIENLILYVITSYRIYVQSKEANFAQCKSQSVREGEQSENDQRKGTKNQAKKNKGSKIRFALYVRLGLLQGLTWASGFLAAFIDSSWCWFIFTVLNGLQGAVIVLCFDIKKWVFLSIWENIFNGPLVSRFSKSTKSTSPNVEVRNKINRGQTHDSKNAKQEQEICEPEDGNEIKILEGKTSSKIWINSSLKRYKDSVAKKLSFGSSVGYRSSQKPLEYDSESESELDLTENVNTGNTQETEISDFLSKEMMSQEELSTQNEISEDQEITKM